MHAYPMESNDQMTVSSNSKIDDFNLCANNCLFVTDVAEL
jgi:hypothetical protein